MSYDHQEHHNGLREALDKKLVDTFGVSASAIVEELIKGELTVEEMSALTKGKLKNKREQLKKALVGHFKEHHKFMLTAFLKHIREIEKIIADIDARIDLIMKPHQEEYELLQTIPGVKETAAASIIAEIGTDMERFPDEEHLSSWAGMSPGKGRLSIRQVQRSFEQWLKAVGINKHLTIHSLRHTFASCLYEKSGNLLAVQQALGHRSITSTMIYTHLNPEQLTSALENL